MSIELINTEIMIAFSICTSILLLGVLFDRHFRIRRAAAVNAAYIAQFQVNGESDRRSGQIRRKRTRSITERINAANLTCEDEVEMSGPGFFGRRRTLSDNSGRVVATHYEEIVLTELRSEREFPSSNRQRHQLAPANA